MKYGVTALIGLCLLACQLACAQGKTGKLVYDVTQFGAKGDDSADDASAIQKAIDAASRDFGTVDIPAGHYLLNAGLTVNAPITIEGSRGGSILDFKGMSSGFSITVGASKPVTGLILEGLEVRGNANIDGLQLNVPGNASGVVADSDFRDLRFETFRWGMRAQYCWDDLFENVRFQNCKMGANLGSQVNATEFTRCSFVSGQTGVQAINCDGLNFTTCEFANLSGLGITIFQSVVNMTMPYVEATPHLAVVGSTSERAKSVLTILSGIVTGDIKNNRPGFDIVDVNSSRNGANIISG